MKNVFISYSHKDEELKKQLVSHMSGLISTKEITVWDDRKILPGESWDDEIKGHLAKAHVVLFLISSDFLSSTYINKTEIENTLTRHQKGEVLFVPIFLRPCDFESSSFSSYQGIPRDAKFITEQPNIDSAFLAIIKELKGLLSTFTPVDKESTPPASEVSYDYDCDIPPDTLKWVGRKKELETLDSSHFKVFFITGLGGQGKSSLASTYVLNKSKLSPTEYWDWRDFKEEGHRLKTKLIEIIRRFSMKGTPLEIDSSDYSFDAILELFFELIEDKSITFVFDNIDAYIDYERFLPEEEFKKFINLALTRKHNSKFLFTCRPFIMQAEVGFHQIELKGLSKEESFELLRSYKISIKKNEEERLFNELFQLTKGHPLWLSLLAGQASRGINTLGEFLQILKDKLGSDDLSETNILSENILGGLWKTLNPKQKKLLRCLSELVKSESTTEMAQIIEGELNHNQFYKALSALKRLNLIVTKTSPSGEEQIELHPLVRNFLKVTLPTNEQSKYISIIIAYYDKVTYVLRTRMSGKETMAFYEKWTNKVELAINNRDFPKALSTFHEIESSIQTAGYVEELYRASKLIFDKIDFNKARNEGYPFFQESLSTFVAIASELAEFDVAKQAIERYKDTVTSKGQDYILLCHLYCKYYFDKLDFLNSIEWGNIGVDLIKASKADIKNNIEHTLSLSKRESKVQSNIEDALAYFLGQITLDDALADGANEKELGSAFYGNIGRCLFFLSDTNNALRCYEKSFKLCYLEEHANKHINRGFISFWIAQLLQSIGDRRNAFFFYSNSIFYWKRHSPLRAKEAEQEISVLLKALPDSKELQKLDSVIIENQCRMFVDKGSR